MKVDGRRGVSPVVATLLLIVISVVSGLTVYFFTSNLTGTLGKVGGQQITELITLDAYTFASNPPSANDPLVMSLRNSGSGAVTVSSVYFDGTPLTLAGSPDLTINPHAVLTLVISSAGSPIPTGFNGVPSGLPQGTSHQVRVVTVDGAVFTFNVIAGSNG